MLGELCHPLRSNRSSVIEALGPRRVDSDKEDLLMLRAGHLDAAISPSQTATQRIHVRGDRDADHSSIQLPLPLGESSPLPSHRCFGLARRLTNVFGPVEVRYRLIVVRPKGLRRLYSLLAISLLVCGNADVLSKSAQDLTNSAMHHKYPGCDGDRVAGQRSFDIVARRSPRRSVCGAFK